MKMEKNPKARNIGLDVELPKEACNDPNCPFHGKLSVRGRTFIGTVVKSDMARTATVEWPRINYIPKYERYEKKKSRVKAHNPDCIGAKVGDKVKIVECRKISKTKSFVVVQKLEE